VKVHLAEIDVLSAKCVVASLVSQIVALLVSLKGALMKGALISALTVVLMLSVNLYADTHDADTHDHGEHFHQQEAHQHGIAEVTLAIEGDNVDMGLESPAANIVGFEHIASTLEQRGLINQAKTVLESPDKLFSFLGTRCELRSSAIDVSSLLEGEEHEPEEIGHKHSGHDESGHESHSEVSANYRFYCQQGSRLTAITLNFFEHFPGIETLHVVWVTDSIQGSAELTTASHTVYLKEM
jgi:hypothetical protein